MFCLHEVTGVIDVPFFFFLSSHWKNKFWQCLSSPQHLFWKLPWPAMPWVWCPWLCPAQFSHLRKGQQSCL